MNEAITDYLKKHLGFGPLFVPGGQVVHIQGERVRIPNGYFGLTPHQDFNSVQGSLNGLVVWVPLANITTEDYPMEVIPGSHLKGLLETGGEGTSLDWEISPDQYHDQDFTPVLAEVGDVVFMSNFTVHRSSQKGNPDNIRVAISTRYDDGKEPMFIDRCYPSAYERSVRREAFHNLSNDEIRAYFTAMNR